MQAELYFFGNNFFETPSQVELGKETFLPKFNFGRRGKGLNSHEL